MRQRRDGGGRSARHLQAPPAAGRRCARSSSPLVLLLAIVEALEKRLSETLPVGEHLPVARPARLELHDLHVPWSFAVGVVVRLRLAELAQPRLWLPAEEPHHIRKMPNVVSAIGAFSAAEIPSASTRRVSSGSMIPSSQSLAVE